MNGAWKILDYSALGLAFREQRPVPERRPERQCAGGAGRRHPALDCSIDFTFRYNKNDTGVPVKGGVPAPAADRADHQPERANSNGRPRPQPRGKTRPVEWWEARVRICRYTNNQGFQDPGRPRCLLRLSRNSRR